jgi:hypothetical protein
MAGSDDSITGDSETRKAILAQRRCIILAFVGATPSSNSSLARVLQNGFLSTVKTWLDDILNGSIGELVLYFHLRVATLFVVGLNRSLNPENTRIFYYSSPFINTGGVDLLLHMLTNITMLPVTKSVVKESGMGKAIGSIEKNKLFAGGPNEEAIKQRVKQIKEAWNKSVKALKEKVGAFAIH